MLETSPLLSNRYKRVEGGSSNGNFINNKNGNNSRRRSSLRFLFFLTVISAIVTYFYDANLAPYNNTADGPVQINQDILRATIAGSTVNEEYGYMLSDEQRALARSMNIEKRVSIVLLLYRSSLMMSHASYSNEYLSFFISHPTS